MLLLDEPAAGMNPNETHEITELIGRLRAERGYTILVIEHDMHVVEGISDRVVALDHGEKLTEGSFHEVANHPGVIEAYLGRNPEALHEVSAPSTAAAQRLAAAGARQRHHLLRPDADPRGDLAPGRRRRAGLPAGRQRLGQVDDAEDDPRHRARREAAACCSTASRSTTWTCRTRIARGLAIVPENRRLFGQLTVLENLELGATLRKGEDLTEDYERVYQLFPRVHERLKQLAGTLSGGEQQMVRDRPGADVAPDACC